MPRGRFKGAKLQLPACPAAPPAKTAMRGGTPLISDFGEGSLTARGPIWGGGPSPHLGVPFSHFGAGSFGHFQSESKTPQGAIFWGGNFLPIFGGRPVPTITPILGRGPSLPLPHFYGCGGVPHCPGAILGWGRISLTISKGDPSLPSTSFWGGGPSPPSPPIFGEGSLRAPWGVSSSRGPSPRARGAPGAALGGDVGAGGAPLPLPSIGA